jgi:hypothetical protein
MLCDVLGRRCARPEFRGHYLLLGRLEQRIHQGGGERIGGIPRTMLVGRFDLTVPKDPQSLGIEDLEVFLVCVTAP